MRLFIAIWIASGLLAVLFMQDYIINKDMRPDNIVMFTLSGPIAVAMDAYIFYHYKSERGTKSTLK